MGEGDENGPVDSQMLVTNKFLPEIADSSSSVENTDIFGNFQKYTRRIPAELLVVRCTDRN
jgi:hypothetical protein